MVFGKPSRIVNRDANEQRRISNNSSTSENGNSNEPINLYLRDYHLSIADE